MMKDDSGRKTQKEWTNEKKQGQRNKRHRRWTREIRKYTAATKDKEQLRNKERENCEYQGLRELTKERGGTTLKAKDRENGLKKDKEQQCRTKTERLN